MLLCLELKKPVKVHVPDYMYFKALESRYSRKTKQVIVISKN